MLECTISSLRTLLSYIALVLTTSTSVVRIYVETPSTNVANLAVYTVYASIADALPITLLRILPPIVPITVNGIGGHWIFSIANGNEARLFELDPLRGSIFIMVFVPSI